MHKNWYLVLLTDSKQPLIFKTVHNAHLRKWALCDLIFSHVWSILRRLILWGSRKMHYCYCLLFCYPLIWVISRRSWENHAIFELARLRKEEETNFGSLVTLLQYDTFCNTWSIVAWNHWWMNVTFLQTTVFERFSKIVLSLHVHTRACDDIIIIVAMMSSCTLGTYNVYRLYNYYVCSYSLDSALLHGEFHW